MAIYRKGEKNMRKIRNLVFMLGALVLFLAACTSGTKKSTTTATTQHVK